MILLEFIDIQQFRGGINNNSDDGPIETANQLVNLIPEADGSLKTRPTVGPLPLSLTPFPVSAGRVFHLTQFDSNFFILTDVAVYVLKDSLWIEVPAYMKFTFNSQNLANFLQDIKKARPDIPFEIQTYFPLFMIPLKAGRRIEIIRNITAPVEFDSHILFRCDVDFPGQYQTPQKGYSQTFALFKTDSNAVGYAVRPGWQEHIENLRTCLDNKNAPNIAAVMSYEYEYIQIPSGLKFVKSGFSVPLNFCTQAIEFPPVGGPTLARWNLEFSLRQVIKVYGLDHFGIFLSGISAYFYYISGLTSLYFLYLKERNKDGLPRQLGIPVPNTQSGILDDQFTGYSLEALYDIPNIVKPLIDLVALYYDTFGAFTNAEIEARASLATAILPHGDFLDRRPSNNVYILNKSLVDLQTNGFAVNQGLLGQFVSSDRQLYLTSGNLIYYSIQSRYDYFDVTARYILDAPFSSLADIGQTTLVFSTKSIYRVEGDVGDTVSFVTRFGDIGSPVGSQVIVRYDRVHFVGSDRKFYSCTRFSVEPENGDLIDKITSPLDGPFFGIRIPELKSFALIFANGDAICRREDIGSFYAMRLPAWISPGNIFKLNGSFQFYRIENRSARFFWFGINDGSDTRSFLYESPTFYPSLISQRASGTVGKSDISSLQSFELFESNGIPMTAVIIGDLQDNGQTILRSFDFGNSARKFSCGMARVKRFQIIILGKLGATQQAVIRRIKISYLRHNDPGASKNEYR